MLSIEITDIRKFTQMLFSGTEFDRFLLHDLTLSTAVATTIDGRKNEAFYSDEEKEQFLREPYVSWEEIRPFVTELIRGKRLPVSFKIVLLTSSRTTEAMVQKAGFTDCAVSSLSLNILFREKQLFLTNGISYLGFTMDKSLERYWDKTMENFLESKDCGYRLV